MILAGVDIGTNSIRLLIADADGASLRPIYAARTAARLGQDLEQTGNLSQKAFDRSLSVLTEFSKVISSFHVVDTAVVGTSALRNADNAQKFIHAVKDRAGMDVSVIAGEEEARLTLLGVQRALLRAKHADLLDEAIVVDIGGGSTELIMIRGGKVKDMTSLHLGAVYLTERYMRSDPPLPEETAALRTYVNEQLERWFENISGAKFMHDGPILLAGTAGTITTLAAMAQKLKQYSPDMINGYVLAKEYVDSVVNLLCRTPMSGRRNLPGLEKGREDIILAGAMVCQSIMEYCHNDAMLVSDWGLREGIVFDLYERHAMKYKS